jgi:Fic family protein
MSWIHHDNMLEGRLFRPEEVLDALVGEDGTMDRYLHPLMEEIRRYRDAIRLVWELAHGGDDAVNLESLKAIHRILTPRSKDRGGLYRQTSPVHRDYYQPICTADKVPYHLRKLFEFIRSECDEACDPVSFAAEVHHRLMFIYPFRRNPGTTARLFTNLLLMSRGYPPAIIPGNLRSEYYEALYSNEPADLARIFRISVQGFMRDQGGRVLRPVPVQVGLT